MNSDNKNYYNYDIDSTQNGYILSGIYKAPKEDKDDYFNTRTDKFVFTTFDGVIDFITKSPLVSPPIKN